MRFTEWKKKMDKLSRSAIQRLQWNTDNLTLGNAKIHILSARQRYRRAVYSAHIFRPNDIITADRKRVRVYRLTTIITHGLDRGFGSSARIYAVYGR